jgi:hypothetical protein
VPRQVVSGNDDRDFCHALPFGTAKRQAYSNINGTPPEIMAIRWWKT